MGLSPSAALLAGRLAEGVAPLVGLELGTMFEACCELLAALEDVMDEDEVLGRVVAGGVGEGRVFMAARDGEKSFTIIH